MFNSYKSRRMLYKNILKNRDIYSERDVYIGEGTTKDFTLSINDVADILSFSVEHVQNNVLNHLDVCDLVCIDFEDERRYARSYMNNNRLKRCVSKSSLEEYITSSLSISSARKIIEIEKDTALIKSIKEVLGKKAKIQELLNDVGRYLDEKYDAKGLMKNEKDRIERLRVAAINGEADFNVMHYLKTKSLDVAEIVSYYNNLEDKINHISCTELFDILTFNMYSIKDLKVKLGKKHTMQVYRHIDKMNHIAVKLNDDEYDEENKKLSDRNIRYIITDEKMTIAKGVYRLPIDYYVFQKLQSMTQIAPGVYSVEDVVRQDVLDFAESNKDKYIKKEKKEEEKQ
jgi:hypothetical protein